MEIVEQGYVIDATKLNGSRRSHCFTSLCLLESGRVLGAFRRGTNKESTDGNCFVVSSEDGGRNWQVVCDGFQSAFIGKPGEVRAAELAQMVDGTLTVFLPGWTVLEARLCIISKVIIWLLVVSSGLVLRMQFQLDRI